MQANKEQFEIRLASWTRGLGPIDTGEWQQYQMSCLQDEIKKLGIDASVVGSCYGEIRLIFENEHDLNLFKLSVKLIKNKELDWTGGEIFTYQCELLQRTKKI